MIQGYPDRPSVHPGEMLILHVSGSSNGATFRVDFYLQDAGLIRQPEQLLDQVSHQAMPGVREADWNWPSYPFQVPEGWQSGAYIAVLYEFDAAGNALNAPDVTTADGYDSKVLFVVKNAAPANPILLKLSLSTYHAYNGEGGGGLYDRCGTLVDGQCTEWISTVAAGSGTDADGVTRTGLKVTLRPQRLSTMRHISSAGSGASNTRLTTAPISTSTRTPRFSPATSCWSASGMTSTGARACAATSTPS